MAVSAGGDAAEELPPLPGDEVAQAERRTAARPAEARALAQAPTAVGA
jgi:hypothetical protein